MAIGDNVCTMSQGFSNPVTERIANFLAGLGLGIRGGTISGPTVLPGIQIERGILIVDEAQLSYPGDLLHEAAHLAVVPAARRSLMDADTGDDGGEEVAAIAWSYAAALHLNLDPAVVFHAHGYHGGSESILENFREGRYIGLPFLRWAGLADEGYPQMIRWLRG
jgi:hypothetical protein